MPEIKQNAPKQPSAIVLANPGDVQVIEHGRDIHMYKLTDIEIDELAASYMSIDFGLLALCVGMLIAFLIAITTAQLSDRMFAVFIALVFVSSLGIASFGPRAWRERQRAKRHVKHIKESRKV